MSELRFNLELIEVAIPCTVPWESMHGSDRVRYCDQCRQSVYQLSEMSREEARELIKSSEGSVCVRFFRRPDGTVVTQDCVEIRELRRLWTVLAFVFLGLVWLLGVFFGPTLKDLYHLVIEPEPPKFQKMTMGAVSLKPRQSLPVAALAPQSASEERNEVSPD